MCIRDSILGGPWRAKLLHAHAAGPRWRPSLPHQNVDSGGAWKDRRDHVATNDPSESSRGGRFSSPTVVPPARNRRRGLHIQRRHYGGGPALSETLGYGTRVTNGPRIPIAYTFSRSSETLRPARPPEAFAAGFVALATLGGIIPTIAKRPTTSREAEHITSVLATRCNDDINKSSAPRGGGSVGRGALNLLLRGFTHRRPQTLPYSLKIITIVEGEAW